MTGGANILHASAVWWRAAHLGAWYETSGWKSCGYPWHTCEAAPHVTATETSSMDLCFHVWPSAAKTDIHFIRSCLRNINFLLPPKEIKNKWSGSMTGYFCCWWSRQRRTSLVSNVTTQLSLLKSCILLLKETKSFVAWMPNLFL